MDPYDHPNYDNEKKRYLEHNNDIFDPRYRKFVKPITDVVFKNFSKDNSGLDFGAGTGPVISQILKERNYRVNLYDPFFHKNNSVLNCKYDYIICCEVIEHFFNPWKEFCNLKNLLNKNGKLICMTEIFSSKIDFNRWNYKDDYTHVFFYSPEAINYIETNFKFKKSSIDNRLIIFDS